MGIPLRDQGLHRLPRPVVEEAETLVQLVEALDGVGQHVSQFGAGIGVRDTVGACHAAGQTHDAADVARVEPARRGQRLGCCATVPEADAGAARASRREAVQPLAGQTREATGTRHGPVHLVTKSADIGRGVIGNETETRSRGRRQGERIDEAQRRLGSAEYAKAERLERAGDAALTLAERLNESRAFRAEDLHGTHASPKLVERRAADVTELGELHAADLRGVGVPVQRLRVVVRGLAGLLPPGLRRG